MSRNLPGFVVVVVVVVFYQYETDYFTMRKPVVGQSCCRLAIACLRSGLQLVLLVAIPYYSVQFVSG